ADCRWRAHLRRHRGRCDVLLGREHIRPERTPAMSVAHEVRAMIVGTAGHIDHGKTSLIKRLTGRDTDRLPEEIKRGISIELGYAYVPVGDDVLGFVDVPGHERFVHTMLAGVTGIDFALLVVAADDGVMPQTDEHLDILLLLGIDAGAVALTKVDAVSAERVDEVLLQLSDRVRNTAAASW